MIKYPTLRIQDYFNLKLKNYNSENDNFIKSDYSEIVFNNLVKSAMIVI